MSCPVHTKVKVPQEKCWSCHPELKPGQHTNNSQVINLEQKIKNLQNKLKTLQESKN